MEVGKRYSENEGVIVTPFSITTSFHQSITHPIDRSALQLTLNTRWIDGSTHIEARDEFQHLHFSCFLIDGQFNSVRPIGEIRKDLSFYPLILGQVPKSALKSATS